MHLLQSAFVQHTAEQFGLEDTNITLDATPYRSGMPINAVALSNLSASEQALYTHRYQLVVGLLN